MRAYGATVDTAAIDGVFVDDVVEYELPFGPLGAIAHALFVRRQLRQIFDYRELAVERAFSARSNRALSTA